MKNLDDALLEEVKKAIIELNKDHSQISTIKIIEKITGSPYTPNSTGIGLNGFLSVHQNELGIEFLNVETINIEGLHTNTIIWRLR
ncbi:hypothetical protein SAMN02745163_02490 [Clostridium cavendishii DSM 21758]|uniref:Uncharacterized protein n=1 Tax=Clostridium cavendishii DSM 21758 TaxID=1121302 RepID=A0A1M6LT85_9CLOT|nr:hypothetical protein [Clostridium cavendishii]SHJ74458.1 hypothetical protein SAMN02745163_02490 [Clostridium cavendishii DSM 21758]